MGLQAFPILQEHQKVQLTEVLHIIMPQLTNTDMDMDTVMMVEIVNAWKDLKILD